MEKVRVGIIGAGYWGPNLIRNFRDNPLSEVTFICDADGERLAVLGERYPGVPLTTRVEEVIASERVDAVVIATPTATHTSLTRAALSAGKHVFVEKPLSTSARDAQALVDLARARGLKLMVGHVFLFNSGIRYLKRLLEEEALGELHYVYFNRTNLGPIRRDVNAWWDLAPHDVSILHYLLGTAPSSVSGRGAAFINPPVEDVVFANLRYADGVFANIHVSWLDPRKTRQLVLVGSRQMAVFDDVNLAEPVRLFDKGVGPDVSKMVVNDDIHLFRRSVFEGRSSTPEIAPAEPLKAECQAFLDYLVHDRPQPSTGELGVAVVRVLEAVSRSVSREGAAQTLLAGGAPERTRAPELTL